VVFASQYVSETFFGHGGDKSTVLVWNRLLRKCVHCRLNRGMGDE
jgi:hypothetical protein